MRRHQKTTVPKGAGATAYKKKTQQLTDLVTSTTADQSKLNSIGHALVSPKQRRRAGEASRERH